MIFAVTGKLACLTNQGTLGKGVLGAKVGMRGPSTTDYHGYFLH